MREAAEPLLQLTYTPIEDLIQRERELDRNVKEMTELAEWLMAEYPGNVYISDQDNYELLYVNPIACDTLQAARSQVTGNPCYAVIQGLDKPCSFCTNSFLKEHESYEWNFENQKLKRPLKSKTGRFAGKIAVAGLSFPMICTALSTSWLKKTGSGK